MGKIVKLALAIKDKPHNSQRDGKTLQLLQESGFRGYLAEVALKDKTGLIKKACSEQNV